MSDFEKMCRIITQFPAMTEANEKKYMIHNFGNAGGHRIILTTNNDHCNVFLYFDSQGHFIGFKPNWDKLIIKWSY